MTRRTNARIAGLAFLLYIAAELTGMVLLRGIGSSDVSTRLANTAQHATAVRTVMVLAWLSILCALALGITLYAITRDEDRELATLGLVCRSIEGALGSLAMFASAALLWLATTAVSSGTIDATSAHAIAAFAVKFRTWLFSVGATFFAIGSTAFAYLLLRGRMIPVPLAWLGVVSSALLVVVLPLQFAGFANGGVTTFIWIPIAAFELTLGPWLLVKGVREAV
jgi:Domain of unknown function (DUF4386)